VRLIPRPWTKVPGLGWQLLWSPKGSLPVV
jgi:hypothetical protein